MRDHLVIQVRDHFLYFLFDSRHCLVEPFVHLFSETFEACIILINHMSSLGISRVLCCKSNAFAASGSGSSMPGTKAYFFSRKRCLEKVLVAVLEFPGGTIRVRHAVA